LIVALIYLLWSVRARRIADRRIFFAWCFVLSYGAAQTLYYMGRSMGGNLHVVVIPFILVTAYLGKQLFEWIRIGGLKSVSRMSHFAGIGIASILIVLVAILVAASNRNCMNFWPYHLFVKPPEYLPEHPNYAPTLQAINEYLATQDPLNRRVALLTMENTYFHIQTQSVDVIDVNNMPYIIFYSQVQALQDQLLAARPAAIFVDHEIHDESVSKLAAAIVPYYHFVQSAGYLDRWERN
jgi:hypothetical protein